MKQQEALIEGLDYISNFIRRFTIVERLYRQDDSIDSAAPVADDIRQLRVEFENQVTKLYAQVLSYQSRTVSQLFRSTMGKVV